MLLSTGVFSLLFLLTRSSPIAAFGTLWYILSPFMQWTYSWPSLLPEMIGLFCLVMCSGLLHVGRKTAGAPAGRGGRVRLRSMVNFALCAYIPHQIPLVWLGVFLCIWWMSARWKASSLATARCCEARTSAARWLVVGLVMFGFYRDAEPALTTMANTVYPRTSGRSPAGAYQLSHALFSHFFSLWADDRPVSASTHLREHLRVRRLHLAGAGHPLRVVAPGRPKTPRGNEPSGYWRRSARCCFIWMTLPVPDAIGRATVHEQDRVAGRMHARARASQRRARRDLPEPRSRTEGVAAWMAADGRADRRGLCDPLPGLPVDQQQRCQLSDDRASDDRRGVWDGARP